jgi:hypothetical protein
MFSPHTKLWGNRGRPWGLTFYGISLDGDTFFFGFKTPRNIVPALVYDGDYSADTILSIDMDAVYLQRSAAMWSELHNIINTFTSLPSAPPISTTGSSCP